MLMGSQSCWKHQILPTCAVAGRAHFGPFTLPLMALAVVGGSGYSLYPLCTSCAEGGCCAVAVRILVGQPGFGHGLSLYTLTGMEGVGGQGQHLCFLAVSCSPWLESSQPKCIRDFIPLWQIAKLSCWLLGILELRAVLCALPCRDAMLPTHWGVASQSAMGRRCFLFLATCPRVVWRKGRGGRI